MNLTKIRMRLSTNWIGRKIHFQETVDSTNNWAELALKEGAQRGEVFLADYQTEGRGRLGRRWESPPGKNILLSFIDIPPLDPSKAHQLTLVAGVGFLSSLENFFKSIPLQLKWPNDLLLEGKKFGGILCENLKNLVIIGVGINVNASEEEFSGDRTPMATSLFIHLHKNLNRENILVDCLEGYERWRGIYDQKGIQPIVDFWNEKSVLLGKKVRVIEPSQSYEGIADRLDESGFLLVKTPEGMRKVIAGDVTLIDI